MNALIQFSFESQSVRVVTDEQGEPWFVAVDVCKILGIGNPSMAVSRVNPKFTRISSIDTSAGIREMLCLSEPGVYKLVFTSRRPEAELFTDWIASEVLPTIRKTGSYSVAQPRQITIGEDFVRNMMLVGEEALRLKEEVKALAGQIEQKTAEIIEMRPTVQKYQEYLSASGLICVTDAAKILGFGPKHFAELLEEHSICYRRQNSDGTKTGLIPYQPLVDKGYMRFITGTYNGYQKSQAKFTTAGVDHLMEKFANIPREKVIVRKKDENGEVVSETKEHVYRDDVSEHAESIIKRISRSFFN